MRSDDGDVAEWPPRAGRVTSSSAEGSPSNPPLWGLWQAVALEGRPVDGELKLDFLEGSAQGRRLRFAVCCGSPMYASPTSFTGRSANVALTALLNDCFLTENIVRVEFEQGCATRFSLSSEHEGSVECVRTTWQRFAMTVWATSVVARASPPPYADPHRGVRATFRGAGRREGAESEEPCRGRGVVLVRNALAACFPDECVQDDASGDAEK